MVLYIIEDAHQQSFIKNGDWLWALPPMIFMISSKIWVTCQRGELDDDPVVFVVKDRVCPESPSGFFSLGLAAAF